jgi:hypothetical protein
MNENQKAAYVTAMAVCALVEAIGMMADNQARTARGEALSYGESAFQDLPFKYGIHHNAIIGMFR